MNKLVLLLLVVFLAACGGVDSPTGSRSTTEATNSQNGPKATFMLQIVEPKSTALGAGYPSTEIWRRVVITNPNIGGMPYKTSRDFDVLNPQSLSFSLPIANGYRVEVLDYYKDKTTFSNYTYVTRQTSGSVALGTYTSWYVKTPRTGYTTFSPNYRVRGYGATNLDLTGSGTTTITMSSTIPTPALSIYGSRTGTTEVPSLIYQFATPFGNISTATFKVFTNISTPCIFNSTQWTLIRAATAPGVTEAQVDAALQAGSGQMAVGGSIAGLYGPYAAENGKLVQHYMAKFYVNSNLLLDNEPIDKFVFQGAKYSKPVTVHAVFGNFTAPSYSY